MSLTNSSKPCHVAAVPYPGRGHVNPMLNLCSLILSKSPSNLLISVVVTEEWLGLINSGDLPPSPSNLRFVTIPNVLPSEIGRANDFVGFFEAVFTKMEAPFEQLLDRIQPKVDAVVADTELPWAVAVANRRNIPVYSFFTASAFFFFVLYHFDRIPISALGEGDEALANYIPGHNSVRLSDLHYLCTTEKPRKRVLEALSMVRKAQCVLLTSFYELEATVIDALREHLHCPVYPIGPSIPYLTLDSSSSSATPAYIEWLDSQPNQSVLYVSLGSFLSVSATQMGEIVMGLRLAGVHFLWVARGDSSMLQEMVGEYMWMLIPWCNQLRVLSHPSVGGFLTHCGWNSTLEGVFSGVPMLTFPIFWDQPVDSRLIVDEWKIGLSLRGEVGDDGIIRREEIGAAVKKLMDLDGVESKEMRRRALELRDSAHRAIEDGGSSLENVNSFLRSLARIPILPFPNHYNPNQLEVGIAGSG